MSKAKRKAALGLLLGSLIFVAACGRNPAVQADEPESKDQQPPFERTAANDGVSPTATLVPRAIPAGTPVTVHLRAPISSAKSHVGDFFVAVLEEPIIVRGQVLAPRGAVLSGRILEARASTGSKSAGYLRLALNQISVSGASVPIRTSSVFIKASRPMSATQSPRKMAGAQPAEPPHANDDGKKPMVEVGMRNPESNTMLATKEDIEFPTGRPLTFRLVESVPISH